MRWSSPGSRRRPPTSRRATMSPAAAFRSATAHKAVELRIFPESMRGHGDGHRPGWPSAPNGTMTNGAVGQTVTSVDGPVLTVKFKDGASEKKLIVGPNVPVQRLE